jgi:hypothetical protein
LLSLAAPPSHLYEKGQPALLLHLEAVSLFYTTTEIFSVACVQKLSFSKSRPHQLNISLSLCFLDLDSVAINDAYLLQDLSLGTHLASCRPWVLGPGAPADRQPLTLFKYSIRPGQCSHVVF